MCDLIKGFGLTVWGGVQPTAPNKLAFRCWHRLTSPGTFRFNLPWCWRSLHLGLESSGQFFFSGSLAGGVRHSEFCDSS